MGGDEGYSVRLGTGEYNLRKFSATIPYSLDMEKLREVYLRAYRNQDFSFERNHKEYSTRVINVNFNYSVKTYNRYYGCLYVKTGYDPRNVALIDGVCMCGDNVIAVQCGDPVENPIDEELLGKYFKVVDGTYVANPNMPVEMSVADLRSELYTNGFTCDGVHYVRFKRSSGSSRVGKCLFIDARLFGHMKRYDMCGLNVRNGARIDLAAYESYIALTQSSIIDTLDIDPNSILLIDDYESVFKENVAAVSAVDGQAVSEYREATITNSIWDGQSLMHTEAFGPYRDKGFVLLRNRFFKSACFNCDVQKFFADHGITRVDQLNGTTRATSVSDIKLITTPSSIKYLKFGTFDEWLDNIESTFGVVKYEKPTPYFDGRMVQTHYQLINTLELSQEEVDELLRPSLDYVRLLKSDPAVMRYHIRYPDTPNATPAPMKCNNDIVYKLLGLNSRFANTRTYANFRDDIVRSYLNNLRKGKILVNGNYSTLCGNPMEMLLQSIGKFDGKSRVGHGNVFSTRFPAGMTLLGSRSPHITIANVWITNNMDNAEIRNYFVTSNEILYINSIDENILQRLSGCDYHKGRSVWGHTDKNSVNSKIRGVA